jgi:hypothetical protein
MNIIEEVSTYPNLKYTFIRSKAKIIQWIIKVTQLTHDVDYVDDIMKKFRVAIIQMLFTLSLTPYCIYKAILYF